MMHLGSCLRKVSYVAKESDVAQLLRLSQPNKVVTRRANTVRLHQVATAVRKIISAHVFLALDAH